MGRTKVAAAVVCVAAAAGMGLVSAQSCCSSDSDCTDMMSAADIEYNNQYGKTLECDQDCPGLVNCNMFGYCQQCRGCFETCEGAMKFMEETSSLADIITFCSGIGVTDLSECGDGGATSGSGSGLGSDNDPSNGGGGGSGSGSGSMSDGGGGNGSASGSGLDSASGGGSGGYWSGAGSGSTGVDGGGSGSASGSGLDSASGGGSGGYGSGAGSGAGSGSGSSSMATASGSGDGSRIADIPGCDCGSAEVEPGYAAYLCDNGKSMYCDLECADGSDPADNLLPAFGGLWCKPQGKNGCRMCKFDCSDYEGGDCVPCPTGVKNWC